MLQFEDASGKAGATAMRMLACADPLVLLGEAEPFAHKHHEDKVRQKARQLGLKEHPGKRVRVVR